MTPVKVGKNDQILAYIHTDDVQIGAESKVKGKLAFSSFKKICKYFKNNGQN